MRTKFSILVSILFLAYTVVIAQHTNFNSQRNWSLNKKEIIFGVGAMNFLGDLGGRNRIGTDYSPVDLDIGATSIGGLFGYRYRFAPRFATTTQLSGGLVRGSDNLTDEVIRKSRNLSFRSPIVAISQRLEWIFYSYEQFGGRYNIPGIRAHKDKNNQAYLFGGIGATYFNPQAKLNGAWVSLRQLHTEGQGLVGGPKQYGFVTAIVPMGIGFRTGIDKVWRVGIEISYTKTFSDYIDDVSTVYYSQSELAAAYGPDAAYLSNPSYQNQYWFSEGQQRGDEQKDSYANINIVFYKNLTYKPVNYKFGRPPKFRGGGRYKF
jgi:hypothetical protein|tara:strand:- start:10437 stop:11396 length:960 start_codon:yes stop_codon:yes gene_type:complete